MGGPFEGHPRGKPPLLSPFRDFTPKRDASGPLAGLPLTAFLAGVDGRVEADPGPAKWEGSVRLIYVHVGMVLWMWVWIWLWLSKINGIPSVGQNQWDPILVGR